MGILEIFNGGKVKQLESEIGFYQNIVKSVSLKNQDFLKLFGLNKESQPLESDYGQLPAVHSCIKWKARNFAQVPFRLFKGEAEVTAGPVYDLFQDINPTIDPFQFWEGISTSLDIDGNAYIILDETFKNNIPTYLWLFNPKWVNPAFDRSGVWVGWWLERPGHEKEFVESERVVQVKYYNPKDEIKGMSPLGVLRMTNDTLWNAMKYNNNFFENDGTPPTVFKTDGKISERQKEEFKQRAIDKRRGVDHAFEAMVLAGGWDVQTLGLSQKDIQFLEQMKFSREDIAMVYGVPKKILGLYEDINFATAEIAELQFWEDNVIPTARMVEFAINKKILKPMGYRGSFDFSTIDVLNKRVIEKIQYVTQLLATGQFTRNELNERFRLGFESVPWGDEPIQIFPASEPLERKVKDVTFPVQAADKRETKLSDAEMSRKWAKDIVPLIPVMSGAAKSVRSYFHSVKQSILRDLAKKVHGEYIMKVALDDIPFDEIEKAFSDEALYAALQPYLFSAIERGFKTIIQTGFTMDNAEALGLLASKRIKVIEMNDNAKHQVVEKLRGVLDEGLAGGIGQDALAKNIIDAFSEQMENIKKRAATIARTEVNQSFSQSRWKAVEIDPPEKIRWISSRDSKVRDSHEHLDGQVVKYGDRFSNGLHFPNDPDGAAAEVINCRCTWEPIY